MIRCRARAYLPATGHPRSASTRERDVSRETSAIPALLGSRPSQAAGPKSGEHAEPQGEWVCALFGAPPVFHVKHLRLWAEEGLGPWTGPGD